MLRDGYVNVVRPYSYGPFTDAFCCDFSGDFSSDFKRNFTAISNRPCKLLGPVVRKLINANPGLKVK